MTKRYRDSEIAFLEHIARKAWLSMNYANAVETSLSEGRLSHLILEKISKEEIKQLEDAAENAQKKLADILGVAAEMNFSNTLKYLEKLQKDLPKGELSLVNLVFGGNPKEAAEKVGKITDIVNKIQRIEDSFKDAIVFFGSQLKKLPFSQDPEKAAAEAAQLAAEQGESGDVEIDGDVIGPAEDVAAQAVTAFKDLPIKDIAANKFMTWKDGIKFPDLGTLEKAAKDSYKPPPEPEGFLGKLGALVGYGELGAGNFAKDLLSSPLSKIIAKADEWESTAEEEPEPVGGDVADDLQALGQGDQSVVGGAGEGGAQAGGAQAGGAATVQLPGIGALQLSPELLAQIFPGFDQSPAAAAEKKKVPIPDLERTVTAPEEVSGVTPELAALINDDPKSGVAFFDPEEAEKAELDAPAPEIGEAWVHTRSAKDWLFEISSVSRTASGGWVYKRPLARSLFVEAIFYKDVVKALKDEGVEDSEIPTTVGELAKRLENQYDIVIKNMPPEAEAAKEEAEGGAEAEDDAAEDDAAPEFDKGDFYDYTTGQGTETAVVVRDELEDNEEEVQVSTLDGKGGWKNAAFATPKTKLGDEIEDEEEALATVVKRESLHRKGKLARSPYYKRGRLREVLLGSKRAPLTLRTEDGDGATFSEHSRWSELAGLEKK